MRRTSRATDGQADTSRPRAAAPAAAYIWAVPALLLMLAGVLSYANSFDGVFLLDDGRYVAENPRIRALWPIGPVL